jgi:hypothetical protein
VRRHTGTIVLAAGLELAACGLLVVAWVLAIMWALSAGSYTGPFVVSVVPFVVGAAACLYSGRRLAAVPSRA